jgi:hypothetical protein
MSVQPVEVFALPPHTKETLKYAQTKLGGRRCVGPVMRAVEGEISHGISFPIGDGLAVNHFDV